MRDSNLLVGPRNLCNESAVGLNVLGLPCLDDSTS